VKEFTDTEVIIYVNLFTYLPIRNMFIGNALCRGTLWNNSCDSS